MKKKLVIFGITNLSEMACFYFRKYTDKEIAAFTVNQEYLKDDSFKGLSLVAFENLEKKFDPADYELFMPLTPNNMNRIREAKFSEAKAKGFSFANFIHPSAVVEAEQVGENNFIQENAVIPPFTKIGDNNMICSLVYTGHNGIIGNHNWLSAGCMIGGETHIRNNCFFGLNSTVKNGLVIESETMVGMNITVNENTKFRSVYIVNGEGAHKLTSDRLKKSI